METEPTINTFKALEETFGTCQTESKLPVIQPENSLPTPAPQDFPSNDELAEDYKKSREVLRSMLSRGEVLLDNMMSIAVQSESARAFEVAANTIRMMSDLANDLVELHGKTNKSKRVGDGGNTEKKIIQHNTQINHHNHTIMTGSSNNLYDLVEEPKTIEE